MADISGFGTNAQRRIVAGLLWRPLADDTVEAWELWASAVRADGLEMKANRLFSILAQTEKDLLEAANG